MGYTIYTESTVHYVLRNKENQAYITDLSTQGLELTYGETFSLQKAFVFNLLVDATAAAEILNKEKFEDREQIQVRKIKIVDIGEVEND